MNLRSLAILAFSMFSVASVRANAAKEVNNGAGLSEQNIAFAFLKMPDLLRVCFETATCELSQAQRSSLGLAIAPMGTGKIRLFFERAELLGKNRYVIEGDVWRINSDLLWKDEAHTVAFGLPDAVLLLLEAANQKTSLLENDVFQKVAAYLSSSVIEHSVHLADLSPLHILLWQDRTRLLLRGDEGEGLEMTNILRELLPDCHGKVRILGPVVQDIDQSDEGGAVVRLLFKLQSGCTSKPLEVLAAVRILNDPAAPATVQLVDVSTLL